jgi:hypothetical protein
MIKCPSCKLDNRIIASYEAENRNFQAVCNSCNSQIDYAIGLKTSISTEFQGFCNMIHKQYTTLSHQLKFIMSSLCKNCEDLSECEILDDVIDKIPNLSIWNALEMFSEDENNAHCEDFKKYYNDLCKVVESEMKEIVKKACAINDYFETNGKVKTNELENLTPISEIEFAKKLAQHCGTLLPKKNFFPFKKNLNSCRGKAESIKDMTDRIFEDSIESQNPKHLIKTKKFCKKRDDRTGANKLTKRLFVLLENFKKVLKENPIADAFSLFNDQFLDWIEFITLLVPLVPFLMQ